MEKTLLIISAVIILSVLTNKLLYKFGVPSLLIFMALGMIFGSDGIGGIYFDDFRVTGDIATVALIFIMFYGGFCTKWETAKPVAFKAILLSFLGTLITLFVTAFFAVFVLKIDFLYAMLLGSVISSTDAASLFSILRSQKLNLKNGLAPLLEMESGSNDPFSYLMTFLSISLIKSNGVFSLAGFSFLFAKQMIFGIIVGALTAIITVLMSKYLIDEIESILPLLFIAMIFLGYALCHIIGGNGLLCVYITGILVGNSRILHKVSLVHFFDSFSWIMEILLFFMIGLLSFPTKLPHILLPGIIMSLIIIFIARPIATFSILSWFKMPVNQQTFVSWVGLRGAASIAFTIFAVSELGDSLPFDIFHIVFIITLFSVVFQGTLTPNIAKKLDLIDQSTSDSVMKTFNDYHEETHAKLMDYKILPGNKMIGKMIVDSEIPDEILIVMIKRKGKFIVPKGSTLISENDVLVLSGENFDSMP